MSFGDNGHWVPAQHWTDEDFARYWPHHTRWGSTRVEPQDGSWPRRTVCECGWQGPERDDIPNVHYLLPDDGQRHEYEANARERGDQ